MGDATTDRLELGERVAADLVGQNDGDPNPYAPRPTDWVMGLVYFANPTNPISRAWMAREGYDDALAAEGKTE